MLVADLKPRKSELMPSRETGDFFLASYLGPVALIRAEPEMQLPIDQRGFSAGSDGKNLPAMQEMRVWSLGGEDPLKKEMATHSSVLAWKIPWTEESAGYSPWGRKESDTT